jgi:hypothetical protein
MDRPRSYPRQVSPVAFSSAQGMFAADRAEERQDVSGGAGVAILPTRGPCFARLEVSACKQTRCTAATRKRACADLSEATAAAAKLGRNRVDPLELPQPAVPLFSRSQSALPLSGHPY